ncbi:hypothetical protein ACGK9R_07950 [Halomonas sp. HNIBRBA4712]|uniref:hypothetical protein n=1 Tax=Halomonas sp. HNIBRBA4712 TaxID=3373087 RepID=UPI003745C25F
MPFMPSYHRRIAAHRFTRWPRLCVLIVLLFGVFGHPHPQGTLQAKTVGHDAKVQKETRGYAYLPERLRLRAPMAASFDGDSETDQGLASQSPPFYTLDIASSADRLTRRLASCERFLAAALVIRSRGNYQLPAYRAPPSRSLT